MPPKKKRSKRIAVPPELASALEEVKASLTTLTPEDADIVRKVLGFGLLFGGILYLINNLTPKKSPWELSPRVLCFGVSYYTYNSYDSCDKYIDEKFFTDGIGKCFSERYGCLSLGQMCHKFPEFKAMSKYIQERPDMLEYVTKYSGVSPSLALIVDSYLWEVDVPVARIYAGGN